MISVDIDSWIQITSYCDIKSVYNILLVSKEINKVDCNLLWNLLIKNHFGIYNSMSGNNIFSYIYFYELEYFDYVVNNFTSFHNNKIKIINPNWNPRVNILYLSYNQISSIPENWNPQVNILDLGHNRITEIPENWNPQMHAICLGNNQIKNIPENWNPQIHQLYLEHNRITEIPENWNPQIHQLFLGNNKIDKKSIVKFKKRNPHITLYL